MYLPKSQTRSNKYTNGNEFVRSDNKEVYVGFYWQDSSGKYYSGKTPQDLPRVQLLVYVEETTETYTPLKKATSWTTDYKPSITSTKPGKVPTRFFPKPTEDQYELGEFQRYFTKKANQNIYYEISNKDYNNLKKQDNSILWQLYQPITLPWQISGDKENVYKVNRNIVLQLEVSQKLPGFRKIFKDNYLQYYKD